MEGLPVPIQTGLWAGGGPGGREGAEEWLSRGEGEGVAQGAAHAGALHHSLETTVKKGHFYKSISFQLGFTAVWSIYNGVKAM